MSHSGLKDCGHIAHTQTGRVQAGTGTRCDFALQTYSRIAAVAIAQGGAPSGTITIGQVSLRCVFHATGHVVYDCRGAGRRVRVWAGQRTAIETGG